MLQRFSSRHGVGFGGYCQPYIKMGIKIWNKVSPIEPLPRKQVVLGGKILKFDSSVFLYLAWWTFKWYLGFGVTQVLIGRSCLFSHKPLLCTYILTGHHLVLGAPSVCGIIIEHYIERYHFFPLELFQTVQTIANTCKITFHDLHHTICLQFWHSFLKLAAQK